MRRSILALTLFLAACATTPQQQQPTPQSPVVQGPALTGSGPLLSLTAAELVGYFGNPALQVREGNSLKLQFRGRRCVLDAFLYPQAKGAGVWRVTHVDTRDTSGRDMNQAACIAALEEPS